MCIIECWHLKSESNRTTLSGNVKSVEICNLALKGCLFERILEYSQLDYLSEHITKYNNFAHKQNSSRTSSA